MFRIVRIVRVHWASAALRGLLFAVTILVANNSPRSAFAQTGETTVRPGIALTNDEPKFTLRLPERFTRLKSTGDALYTFGTMDRTAGALIAIYRLGHVVERGSTDVFASKQPDAHRTSATWKTFALDVHAWHTTGSNGTKWAARWVAVPLERQAATVLELIPVAKEADADALFQEFLNGIDGPSNWRIEHVLTPTERAARGAVGVGLLLVLLVGPVFGLRHLRRSMARRSASPSAAALRLRVLAATVAEPARAMPGYWIRVLAIVFMIIASGTAYLAAAAAAVSLILNQSFGASFMAVAIFCELVCLLMLLAVFGFWIQNRRRRGRVLMDFGPDRLRLLYLSVGMLSLATALMSGTGAVMKWNPTTLNSIALPALQLVLALQFFARATGRVQITDAGIWQNLNLVRWEKIGSYRWRNDSTLLAVIGAGPASLALSIPADRKESVEDLLARHCIVQATT